MNITIRNYLGYAGLVPFLLCCGCLFAIKQQWLDTLLLSKVNLLFITYSSIILSFLAGANWGRNIENDDKICVSSITNIIALMAWLSLLFHINFPSNTSVLLIVLTINTLGFIVIYLEEKIIFNDKKGYAKLRSLLTFIVISCHGLMAVQILS